MLRSLFLKAHLKFLSMPLLGPIADSFDDWLAANGYTRSSREYFVSKLPRVDADLRNRQVKEVADLSPPVLHGCWRTLSKTYPGHARTVRTLERYLAAEGLITRDRPVTALSPASILIEDYGNYLLEVRGFASSTVSNHKYTARCFPSAVDQHTSQGNERLARATLRDDVRITRDMPPLAHAHNG